MYNLFVQSDLKAMDVHRVHSNLVGNKIPILSIVHETSLERAQMKEDSSMDHDP